MVFELTANYFKRIVKQLQFHQNRNQFGRNWTKCKQSKWNVHTRELSHSFIEKTSARHLFPRAKDMRYRTSVDTTIYSQMNKFVWKVLQIDGVVDKFRQNPIFVWFLVFLTRWHLCRGFSEILESRTVFWCHVCDLVLTRCNCLLVLRFKKTLHKSQCNIAAVVFKIHCLFLQKMLMFTCLRYQTIPKYLLHLVNFRCECCFAVQCLSGQPYSFRAVTFTSRFRFSPFCPTLLTSRFYVCATTNLPAVEVDLKITRVVSSGTIHVLVTERFLNRELWRVSRILDIFHLKKYFVL